MLVFEIITTIVLFFGSTAVWLPHIWRYIMENIIFEFDYAETGAWWERLSLYIYNEMPYTDWFDASVVLGLILTAIGTIMITLMIVSRKKLKKINWVLFCFAVLFTLSSMAGVCVNILHILSWIFDFFFPW